MPHPATYDDVNLILRLYEIRREEKLRLAREWFGKSFRVETMEDFMTVCAPGTDANAYFRMVVSYWEMVASFVTSGVLNDDLFYQSGRELLFCWVRLSQIVPAYREAAKNPNEWKNLETVANAFIQKWNAQSPGAYEAFSARVRG
jgi:hypothetical protein